MTSRHTLTVKVKKQTSPQQCRESKVLNTVMRLTAFSPSELSENAGIPQGESVRKGRRPPTVVPNPNRAGDSSFSYENKQ